MTTEMMTRDVADVMEKVVIGGDLSKLSADERIRYYSGVCASLGLNPLTRPFNYLTLSGKLVLYATKDATEQLRKLHGVSITKLDVSYADDLVMVVVCARDGKGRTDSDIGAVQIGNLKGEQRANAILKATTKSKRRVTLSICGLGMLDESEVESIPGAQVVEVDLPTDSPVPQSRPTSETVIAGPQPSVGERAPETATQAERVLDALSRTETVDQVLKTDTWMNAKARRESVGTAIGSLTYALGERLVALTTAADVERVVLWVAAKAEAGDLSAQEASSLYDRLDRRFDAVAGEVRA